MTANVVEYLNTSVNAPIPSPAAAVDGEDRSFSVAGKSDCHGVWYDAVLVNLKKLSNGRSYIMISYYALVWVATLLNLAWCSLQGWQCSAGKAVAWNLLSLFTASAIMCLEISLVSFLLQDNYTSGVEALAQTFLVSGIIVTVDLLLKAIYVFGFGVPLFIVGVGEKLPPRPAFYNYIVVMFVFGAVALFACGLAGIGAGFGIWLYNLTEICYHSLYLPFLYVTFLADFFQEEQFLLDNAYYSEMKDAGFFDADWD
ncbi:hypothetical protein M0R45_023356 [Rubus argutus]|uniref:Uncharacterized protein n=1 Tax=Rubus argutus TaxID=59490 RepID=A0AAW1WN73_RUBAR